MAVDPHHLHSTQKSLAYLRAELPKKAKVLISGVQEIYGESKDLYGFDTVAKLFRSWGWEVYQIDLHDPAAEFRRDLGVYQDLGSFDLVFDIGTIEHVADSQMVLNNYLNWICVGGYLYLLTPVKGYYDHGFHTFSPEYIQGTLTENKFVIQRQEWLTMEGPSVVSPDDAQDVLIVLVAQKKGETTNPIRRVQQKRWVR